MKYLKKSAALLFALVMVISFTACGGHDDYEDDNGETTDDVLVTSMDYLAGVWSTPLGNQLRFDIDGGCYVYETYYGRTGRGELSEVDGRPMIEFDGFMYDFYVRGDSILLPNQNGDGDAETINHFYFTRSDSGDVTEWELSNFDGAWQNALGETLVIDSSLMQYIACSPDMMSSGTLSDEYNGKGAYLYLNGYAYLCTGITGDSFMLRFENSDSDGPDGTYTGIFYRNGDIDAYTNMDEAGFYYNGDESDELWYTDGVSIFCLGDGYTIGENDLAYDESGNVFGAGWQSAVYDPSVEWGEDWADNWD